MHRLFGKSKPKVEAPTLEDTSGGIGKRISDVEKKINDLDNELRKYKMQLKTASGPTAANIKKRAMDVLKRKRMYETQRDQMANQQFNVDQTSFAIETVRSTQTTVSTMKAAAKTLKKENKKINLSELEDMQDEMEDMLEDVGEISDILGRSYGCPDGVEEEDLDAELACLDDEIVTDEVDFADSSAVQEADGMLSDMPAEPTASPLVSNRAEAAASTASSQKTAQPQYNSMV